MRIDLKKIYRNEKSEHWKTEWFKSINIFFLFKNRVNKSKDKYYINEI